LRTLRRHGGTLTILLTMVLVLFLSNTPAEFSRYPKYRFLRDLSRLDSPPHLTGILVGRSAC
jgi:hypothetical protein